MLMVELDCPVLVYIFMDDGCCAWCEAEEGRVLAGRSLFAWNKTKMLTEQNLNPWRMEEVRGNFSIATLIGRLRD